MTKVFYALVIALFTLVSSANTFTNNEITVNESEHLISSGAIYLAGTLGVPKKRRLNQLVIMISGSGPQDRDETLDGFKVFKELSDHLNKQGIATFRFDDRGVNKSTGNFPSTTLEDHSNDVRAIMDYFKSIEKHGFREFILFGHSQGGIVSANVAVGNTDVKKVVLMGAPSVPLIDIVLYQVRQEYVDKNLSKELVETDVSSHNKLIHAIAENKNIDYALHEFKTITKSILSHEQGLNTDKISSIADNKT